MDNPIDHPFADRIAAYVNKGRHESYSPQLVSKAFGIYPKTAGAVMAALAEVGRIKLLDENQIDKPSGKRRYVGSS